MPRKMLIYVDCESVKRGADNIAQIISTLGEHGLQGRTLPQQEGRPIRIQADYPDTADQPRVMSALTAIEGVSGISAQLTNQEGEQK